MTSKDSIFLTTDQAVKAICLDFKQYKPQIFLFSEIISVLALDNLVAKRELGKDGIWLKMPGHKKMHWLDGDKLVKAMCEILENYHFNLAALTAVCARVFQAKAQPDENPETGQEGIRIFTGMENFECQQCGKCCRTLDYHDDVTVDDVTRWEKDRKIEILKWVGVFHKENEQTVYRIWVKPGTRELAPICPFLSEIPHENRWICRIHKDKPRICRQYPVSRKHAIMTGCPGFSTIAK